MIRVFVLVGALLVAQPCAAALSVVQDKSATYASGAATTIAATITSSTAGNLLIAVPFYDSNSVSTPTVSGVSGGGGNTFTQFPSVRATFSTSGAIDIWYLANNAGGITTVTATFSASVTGRSVWVLEVSGADTGTTTVRDVGSTVSNAASATNVLGASMTTANAADIIVTGFLDGGTFTTANSPWTASTTINNGNGLVYQIVAATGSYQGSGNQTPSATFSASQASFKAAAGGGGCTLSPTLTLLGVGNCKGH